MIPTILRMAGLTSVFISTYQHLRRYASDLANRRAEGKGPSNLVSMDDEKNFFRAQLLCERSRTDCTYSPYSENENDPITKVAIPTLVLDLVRKIAETASEEHAIRLISVFVFVSASHQDTLL